MMAKTLVRESIDFDILNPTQLFLLISNHENGRNHHLMITLVERYEK